MKYLFLALLLSISALASDNCKHDDTAFRCVKYVKSYDGDTITFEIPNVHPLLGQNINIRVLGIDTPEKRTKNKCEKVQAIKAKQLVENILKKAKRIDLVNIKRGKYFRVVADVIADEVNIKRLLIEQKLAYEYYGKAKKKVDWCSYGRMPALKK